MHRAYSHLQGRTNERGRVSPGMGTGAYYDVDAVTRMRVSCLPPPPSRIRLLSELLYAHSNAFSFTRIDSDYDCC